MWKAFLGTLLCLGLLSACDESQTPGAPDRPGSLVQDLAWAPVALTDRCPPIHQRLLFPPGGKLPQGASVVRLCNGPAVGADPGSGFPGRYDMPEDALTTGIGDLIDQVNGSEASPLPPSDQPVFCSDDGGSPINFWFGYPDGTAAAVSWHPYGCEQLFAGREPSQALLGGRDLLAAYGEALAAQRNGPGAIPSQRPGPGCNPTPQAVSPLGYESLGDLSGVTYCLWVNHQGWREARVPRDVVRRINAEAVPGHTGRGCIEQAGVTFKATTSSGDRVDLYPAAPCRWTLPMLPDSPEPWPSWRPSKALARALNHLPLGPIQRPRLPNGEVAR